ncbi:MAG: oligosaccharide flippase family protein [Thermoplasmata archaeon]|nr:MAG: oligosaccharide flippase family protein [Thermoplasmata archaeon]
MSVKKKLMRNTIMNSGVQLWTTVLNFVLMLIIIYFVGLEEYGIYLLVAALTGYFGLLDLGIGKSLLKFIAEYHAKKDKQKVNEVVNTAFFIFLLVGVIGAICVFIIGTFFIDVFKIEDDLLSKARLLTYLLAVTLIFGFCLNTFSSTLAGLQRYDRLAYINFAMSLVNAAVTMAVLLLGYGIVELLFYTICIGLTRHIIVAFQVNRYLPYLSIKFSFLKRDTFRTLFRLSLMLLFFSFFARIIYYTDTLVIGFFLGVVMITIYTAAWKISEIPVKAYIWMLSATIPATSELDALRREKALQELFLRVLKYCLALLFLFGIPILLMSKEILKYIFNPTGGDFALYHLVTNILIISLFFDFFNLVSFHILTGMNKIKVFIGCYGVVAVFNLVLSIILVNIIGLEGVALGTAVPFIVMAPVFMWYAFKTIGIRVRDYGRTVLLSTFPWALLSAGVLFGLTWIHTPANFLEVVVYFIIGMAVYLLLFYYRGLDDRERSDIKGILEAIRYKEEMDVG